MTGQRLRVDPLLPWEGGFPYLAMAGFGITPESTATQVLDAGYAMTPDQNADPVLNDAWEALRNTRSRLIADFFCLDLPDPAPALPNTARPAMLALILADAIEAGVLEALPEVPLPACEHGAAEGRSATP